MTSEILKRLWRRYRNRNRIKAYQCYREADELWDVASYIRKSFVNVDGQFNDLCDSLEQRSVDLEIQGDEYEQRNPQACSEKSQT